MTTTTINTEVIEITFSELMNVTNEINKYFLPLLQALNYLTYNNTNWNTYSQTNREMVIKTNLLAKTLLNLLEVNLLTEKGSLTQNSKISIKQAKNLLTDLKN